MKLSTVFALVLGSFVTLVAFSQVILHRDCRRLIIQAASSLHWPDCDIISPKNRECYDKESKWFIAKAQRLFPAEIRDAYCDPGRNERWSKASGERKRLAKVLRPAYDLARARAFALQGVARTGVARFSTPAGSQENAVALRVVDGSVIASRHVGDRADLTARNVCVSG